MKKEKRRWQKKWKRDRRGMRDKRDSKQ